MDRNQQTNTLNDLSENVLQEVVVDQQGPAPSVATRSQRNPDVVAKVRQYTQSMNGNKTLVFPHDTPKYFMYIKYAKYSRSNPFRVDFTDDRTIVLPLPSNGIVDTGQVGYEEKEVGTGAGTVWSAGSNIANRLKGIDSVAQGARELMGAAGNVAEGIGGIIASNVAQSGLPGIDAVMAAAGVSPNNFLTIMLKGPVYKRHEFTWKLAPRDNAESETIRKIIKEFNNARSPGLTLGGAMFTFPYIFWLSYMPNSKYLYKFKPAVMEDISFNYTPTGIPSFFHDTQGVQNENPPESIEIKARFIELEYWLRNQFGDSNDPFAPEARLTDGAYKDELI